MQPAPERALHPYRSGLAGQEQERGLEGVVGIVGIIQHAATDTQDHRAMPPDECLEGQFVAMEDVSFQQPGVGQAHQGSLAEEAVDRPQGGVASYAGHDNVPPMVCGGSSILRAGGRGSARWIGKFLVAAPGRSYHRHHSQVHPSEPS